MEWWQVAAAARPIEAELVDLKRRHERLLVELALERSVGVELLALDAVLKLKRGSRR